MRSWQQLKQLRKRAALIFGADMRCSALGPASVAGPKRRASTLGNRRQRDGLKCNVARHCFFAGPGTPARTLARFVPCISAFLALGEACCHAERCRPIRDSKGKHCWSRSGTTAAWGLTRACRERQARSREGARARARYFREWSQSRSAAASCRWLSTRASPKRQLTRKEIGPSAWCWSTERPGR